MIANFNDGVLKFIRRVMPSATEKELGAATATFEDYMRVIWEIVRRVEREGRDLDSPNRQEFDRVK
jgi:exonuclease VII small subunit